MTIRLFALIVTAALGLASAGNATPRHRPPPPVHAYDAVVGTTRAHAQDPSFTVLQTGDSRTTATGGPSGGIN